ncbi:unnamed protein product [Absidia cylindrospora]
MMQKNQLVPWTFGKRLLKISNIKRRSFHFFFILFYFPFFIFISLFLFFFHIIIKPTLLMSTCIQHRAVPTTLGLSLGFLGVVGLVISLLSLVPINIYNIYLASHTALALANLEYQRTHQWWSFSSDALYYFIFLLGSVVSSLITTCLVLITCLAKRKSFITPVDIEANCTKKYQRSNLWLSRMACVVFIGQISWALYGNHLLWFVSLDMTQIRESTTLSVWILWLNYGVLILFSFVLFCASFFIIIGTSLSSSNNNHHHRTGSNSGSPSHGGSVIDTNSASDISVGEMQQQETTPLLNKSSCHRH